MKHSIMLVATAAACLFSTPALCATKVTIRSQNIDFFGNANFEGQRNASGVLTSAGLTTATGEALSDVNEIRFSIANLVSLSFTSATDYSFLFRSGQNELSALVSGTSAFLGARIVNRDTGALTSFSVPPANISVQVEEIADAVPEPATWALMLAGFGMVGYAMRRRRSSVAFA